MFIDYIILINLYTILYTINYILKSMQITIDIDVLENLLIHNNRRNNDQQSVFALVLGKQIGPNSFHITDFIYKYIEYNNDNKIENKKSDLYLVIKNLIKIIK